MTLETRHRIAGELAPHSPLFEYYCGEEERRRLVREFFDETAPSYEWIIRFMSFGSGDWYRRKILTRSGLVAGMRVLDVACGTGAISRQAVRLAGRSGHVIGIDPSTGMLRENRKRVGKVNTRIPLVQGFAETLPFGDHSFDFLSMGYALRHVSDLNTTFAEYFRVLRPGGRLAILEFTRPTSRVGFSAIHLFLDKIVPFAALIRSGKYQAREFMRYCWDTVEQSIPHASILAAIERSGFKKARCEQQFGILGNYMASKGVV
jgi:demethylmenaquinone methyltransferase / 2-methoxy-6-polyprenyl-1,4-benzoquinol methylase